MADQSGPETQLVVRTLEHGQFSYSFPITATVADLKRRLEASTGIPVARHRVLLRGRELTADDATLSSLNLPDNAVLHLATRPPPEAAQRSGGGGGAATAPAPGPQGPGFAQGVPAPGGAFNPMEFMSMLQGLGIPVAGGGPGGGGGGGAGIGIGPGGVMGTISIGSGGVTAAGPFGGNMGLSPDQEAAIQSSLEQILSGTVLGAAGGVPITFSVGGPGGAGHHHHHHHHHHHGDRNAAPPRLDAQGRYRSRSLVQGIDEMLVRLQNGNMQEDPFPSVAFTSADALRRPVEAPAWAAAAAAFLAACRPVLRGAALSRETLAAVNRVFDAAGLSPLPLGVRSFPLEGLDHSGNEGERGGDGDARSVSASEPPSLITDPDTASETTPTDSYDSEEDSEYYGYGEEESEEDEDEWNEESEEGDDEWETDEGEEGAVVENRAGYRAGAGSENDEMPELVSEPGSEDEGASRRRRTANAAAGTRLRFFNPPAAAAAAAARDDSDSDTLPELCDDSSEEEGVQPPPRTRRRISSPPPLIPDDDDDDDQLPPLLSDSEDDGAVRARRAGRARPAAAAAPAAPAPATTWLRSVSDDDLILVAAVTVGELTRRFMAVLGQESAPVGVNALAVRLAARLRSLTSLDGASRREIVRQTRLVSGHLLRVSASAAELGRAMQYLTGALGDAPNMHFLATQPGFIEWQGGRPVASLSGEASGAGPGGWGAVPPPGAGAAVRMEVRRVPAPAMAPSAPPPAPPPVAQPRQTQPQAQQQQQPPAAAQVASVMRNIAERPGVPPGVANVLSELSNAIGTGGADASTTLVSELSSGLTALNRLMVTSLDINGITRDVQQAVTASLAGGAGAAGSPSAAASAAAAAVEGALRRHIRGLGQDAEVQERLGELGGVLGVDVLGMLRTLGGDEPPPGAVAAAPAAAATPAPAPAAARAPAAAATPAPAPAGLGRGLQPRSGGGGGSGPVLPPRPGSGGPALPPRRPAAQTSSNTARAPAANTAAPSASASTGVGAAAAAGGSGAGLSSLLSTVMSNPAMQQAAGQLLGGGSATGARSGSGAAAPGGGLDLSALMNAAGPMLGQLMGGGGAAGAGGPPSRTPSGRARPAAQPQPADLESALAAAGLSAEEAARWKATIEEDVAAQAAMGPQETFSDAYLAAMPPRAASGLLAGLLGDD